MNRSSRILLALFAVIEAVLCCLSMAPLCYWAVLMLGAGDGSGPGMETALLVVGGAVLVLFLPLLAFVFMFLTAFNGLKSGIRRFTYWYVLIVLIIVMVVSPTPGSMRYSFWGYMAKTVFLAGAALWGFAFRPSAKQERTPVA
ncbi:MAG TPA: hypothetical protein VH595_14805 [Verrucomicrobiae bacterium]|jgi:hypothetical protein|nr:hypothetical protein [Verrucomicrobiae bacterium]